MASEETERKEHEEAHAIRTATPGDADNSDRGLPKKTQQIVAFIAGVVFIITMLVLAIFFPEPKPFPYLVFRAVLALAAAGFAAMIPGFLDMRVGAWLRAGGALAVFAIVFFYNPATLVAESPRAQFEQARARAFLAGYDGAFVIARQVQGQDTFPGATTVDTYLRQLGLQSNQMPKDLLGVDKKAGPAAEFAQRVLSELQAKDMRLAHSFRAGWLGVITVNTPSLKPAGFDLRQELRDAGFEEIGTSDEGAILQRIADECRRSLRDRAGQP